MESAHSPPRVLVVDDDREIRSLVSDFLSKQGLNVTTAADGRGMAAALADGDVDMVILDLMLPDKHGLEICREIRARSAMPILILTAMGEETDRIVGLEVGADDYLSKPFNPRELLARVRAVLRRSRGPSKADGTATRRRVRFAGWELDLGHRRLTSPEGLIIELTTGEYELLAAFADHPQQVLSRNQLMELVRGRDHAARIDRSIDVQVSRLRRKIEDGNEPGLILTVRGDGYLFTPEVEVA